MTGCSLLWRALLSPVIGFIFVLSFQASASLVITGTRIIYPSVQKEVTVKIDNAGKNPVLYQSWIDTGNSEISPDKIDVPFVITPPIGRINPGKGQSLRLVYVGKGLPTDRESVFWFNILEIPAEVEKSAADLNVLKMAFRSRIKLFYRPAVLDKNVSFKNYISIATMGDKLTVENRSPYYFSLVRIESTTVHKLQNFKGVMVAPFSKQSISVDHNNKFSAGSQATAYYIDDYGAEVGIQTVIH